MQSSSDHSRINTLLTLPSELRIDILRLALHPLSTHVEPDIKTAASTYVALQLTCRSVREDTSLPPFRYLPLISPMDFGSDVSTTVDFLRSLRPWQISAIKTVNLCLMGSMYEIFEGGKAVAYLKNEQDAINVATAGMSPDVICALADGLIEEELELDSQAHPEDVLQQSSGLQELNIQITARDVVTPMADAVVGMRRSLDVDASPVFAELIKGRTSLPNLRKLDVLLQLSPNFKDEYHESWALGWQADLQNKLNDVSSLAAVQVNVTVKRCPKLVSVMQEYFTALAGDSDWWEDEVDSVPDTMGSQLMDLHTDLGRV